MAFRSIHRFLFEILECGSMLIGIRVATVLIIIENIVYRNMLVIEVGNFLCWGKKVWD